MLVVKWVGIVNASARRYVLLLLLSSMSREDTSSKQYGAGDMTMRFSGKNADFVTLLFRDDYGWKDGRCGSSSL